MALIRWHLICIVIPEWHRTLCTLGSNSWTHFSKRGLGDIQRFCPTQYFICSTIFPSFFHCFTSMSQCFAAQKNNKICTFRSQIPSLNVSAVTEHYCTLQVLKLIYSRHLIPVLLEHLICLQKAAKAFVRMPEKEHWKTELIKWRGALCLSWSPRLSVN